MSKKITDWFSLLAVFLFLFLSVGFMRWSYSDTSLTRLLIEGMVILLILVLVILKRYYPKIEQVMRAAISYYWIFLITYAASFLPIIGFFILAKKVIGETNIVIQSLFLVSSFSLLFAAMLSISIEQWRVQLFKLLARFGWFSPFVYLFNFMLISVILFGTMTFLIYRGDVYSPNPSIEINFDHFLNVYIWHLLDSIPAVNITENINWDEPLKQEPLRLLGLFIVLFKLIVIIPGVGAFVAYWQSKREA
jgi:hypothetical protein